MTGGGGDRGRPPPPSSSSPTTGGEFLLQLLQKPQTQCHFQTPINFHSSATPSSSPSHPVPPHHHNRNLDPAVAAMGPSLSFPSNTPPWIESTNFPAPLPTSNTHTPWGLTGLPPNLQLAGNRPPIFPDEFRRLGLLGGNGRHGNQPPHHKEQSTMMFGSLPGDFRNQNALDQCNSESQFGVQRVREVVGASSNSESSGIWCNPNRTSEFDREVDSHGSCNLWNNSPQRGERGKGMPRLQQHVQSQTSPHMVQQRSAPPGFPQKPKGFDQWGSTNPRRELEGNVGKQDRNWGKLNGQAYHSFDSNGRPIRNNSSSGQGMQGNVSSRLQLSGQLDHPGPPMGSNLQSVPALDIEESLATLHAVEEDGGNGLRRNQNKSRNSAGGSIRQINAWPGEDDLSEQLMNSIRLKNGWEKNIGRHTSISDDKDLRLGVSRELQPPGQRMRNSRRVVDCRSDIDKMNAPFLAIYESLVPAEEEKAKQKQLLTLLERLVNKEWPKAQLYLYGSCANSFGVSKSDIDVCLAIEGRDINKSELLLKLADILQEDNLENVQALTRARVPIVKLMDPVTGISCDICVNNVLAVVNTKLLRDYAQIDERLRQLAFIVKHWAKSRGVNVTYHGTLSSYAYVLMCIHFLQQRKPAILPCLQEMEATYVVSVDDIECAYFDQVQNLCDFGSQNKENIAKLVWSFFDYWAYRHDYANAVISVRTGSIISKRSKDWTRRIGNDRHLICIEDPFETSHDLGRVVDKYSIKVLREEFERAANIMQYDPDPCVTLFEPYVPR